MNSSRDAAAPVAALDVGEYCRRVEEHLTRVNEGELIRIFGTSFDLVRGWALEGIPLSVVLYGIDRKAERHRAGTAKRALRLEFCTADVREAYAHWRRALGLHGGPVRDAVGPASGEAADAVPPEGHRRPALSKELDRAAERLVRAAGRMDTPATIREAISATLEAAVGLRERSRKARGASRDALATEAAELDARMLETVRLRTSDLADVRAEAEAELAPYRQRLAPDIWERSVAAGIDRLLRERYGLPTLDFDRL